MHCLFKTLKKWVTSLSPLYQAPSRKLICPSFHSQLGTVEPGILALSHSDELHLAGIPELEEATSKPTPQPNEEAWASRAALWWQVQVKTTQTQRPELCSLP